MRAMDMAVSRPCRSTTRTSDRDAAYILPTSSITISRKRPGLTLGFFFLAWPIRLPAACSLPALMSATILGLAATNSWHSATSARFVDLLDAQRLHRLGRPTCPRRPSRRTLRGPRLVSSSPALNRCRAARPAACGRSGNWSIVDLLLVQRAQHVLLHPVAGQLAVAAAARPARRNNRPARRPWFTSTSLS